MICIVEHFRIQRILLFAIGVWPYNQSKCVQFQYLLLSVVLNSFVIFQLTPFINSELTVDLIIKLLSTIFFSLLCLIHQVSFWINIDVVKGFVERLQDVCNDLKDEKEIAIIKKYANSAEYISILVILLAVCCAFIITLMPIYPRILSTVLLVNISRPLYNMQFVTEYFIDKEKNFYLILLHTYAFLYIAIIVLVGGGLMGCAYLKHVCGLFSIASYRIEQSMIANIHEKTDQWNKMKKKIRLAVDAHRTAIDFNETYFCLMVVAVLCLCLNLYKVCQTVLRDKVEEFLLHLILAISMLVYSFLANSCGEEITEHYNNMFSSAYSIEWYRAPIRVQKLILFLLQRSCKMHGIKIGGLFTASLEGFASLSTASVSYFTVIYSMQN
ncbi:odorant receptor 24a isoform X7 [Ooceraea biroi]|uniref:odorant receptor 24a isoform X7 n=1 Tax=Ooceraea biroi TaxID=2015173 RepID=UPI0009716EC0|nr:odorant receptor 24a isoform X7 [Ooceraea biroi]